MQKNSKIPPRRGPYLFFLKTRFFFKNEAMSLLHPFGSQTSCNKARRAKEQSQGILLKTDWVTCGLTMVITMESVGIRGRYRNKYPFLPRFFQNLKSKRMSGLQKPRSSTKLWKFVSVINFKKWYLLITFKNRINFLINKISIQWTSGN